MLKALAAGTRVSDDLWKHLGDEVQAPWNQHANTLQDQAPRWNSRGSVRFTFQCKLSQEQRRLGGLGSLSTHRCGIDQSAARHVSPYIRLVLVITLITLLAAPLI